MQPDSSQWRTHSTYDYLDDLQPDGYAWEFLRRNEDYQRDYRERVAVDQEDMEGSALERRWGLRFFRATKPKRGIPIDLLVANRRYGRPDPYRGTIGFRHAQLPPAALCHAPQRQFRRLWHQRQR